MDVKGRKISVHAKGVSEKISKMICFIAHVIRINISVIKY